MHLKESQQNVKNMGWACIYRKSSNLQRRCWISFVFCANGRETTAGSELPASSSLLQGTCYQLCLSALMRFCLLFMGNIKTSPLNPVFLHLNIVFSKITVRLFQGSPSCFLALQQWSSNSTKTTWAIHIAFGSHMNFFFFFFFCCTRCAFNQVNNPVISDDSVILARTGMFQETDVRVWTQQRSGRCDVLSDPGFTHTCQLHDITITTPSTSQLGAEGIRWLIESARRACCSRWAQGLLLLEWINL